VHNNYHFFQYLVPKLQEKLLSKELFTCYSQNKDELILSFADAKESFYIKATLDSQFSCLSFPDDFARAKKNSVNLFKELILKKVIGLKLYENERCFHIAFEQSYTLLFKLHGRRANIILYHGQQPYKLFKNSLKNDTNLQLSTLDRQIDQSYDSFVSSDELYATLFPTWGKLPKHWLTDHSYSNDWDTAKKWALLTQLNTHLNLGKFYIILFNGELHLSLLQLGDIQATFDDPIEAITSFYYTKIKQSSLAIEQKAIVSVLEKKAKGASNYITENTKRLQELKYSASYAQKADLIMANMHQIVPRSAKVEVSNFYDDGNTITIKLNKELSPQKNAERYYRKAKNQRIEIQKMEENIEIKEFQLLQIEEQLDNIKSIEELRSLRKYLKEENLDNKKQKEQTFLFKKFVIDGFDVWVGKSAANNDLLTLKYAKKDDLWFHAKDVSGSHTVLKAPAGKEITPQTKEKVAIIAAYYSKRKNDTLCPVIVTYKKFVRKPKGFAVGKVVVDKEEVILVDPSEFKNVVQEK